MLNFNDKKWSQEFTEEYTLIQRPIDLIEREIRKYRNLEKYVGSTQGDRQRNVALRYSAKKGIDLFSLKEGKISPVSYVVQGSGQEIVGTQIADSYNPSMSLKDGITLVTDGINAALAHQDHYQGYCLVIVQKQKDGFQVQTAADLHAHSINRTAVCLSKSTQLPSTSDLDSYKILR